MFWIKDVNPTYLKTEEQLESGDHLENGDHSKVKENENINRGETSSETEEFVPLEDLDDEESSANKIEDPKAHLVDQLKTKPFSQQARSPLFLFLLIYVPPTILFLNTYLGTAQLWLQEYASSQRAANLTEIFGFVLPSVVLVSPLIGYIVDRAGLPFSFLLNQILALAWTLSSFVSSPADFQILTFMYFLKL